MKPADSHHGRSYACYTGGENSNGSGRDFLRRPLVAVTEMLPGGKFSAPRIRIYAIADLKEFNRKDRYEDRARSWISKAKSAFSLDQDPDEEKSLVFGDLLTGPAQNWYLQ